MNIYKNKLKKDRSIRCLMDYTSIVIIIVCGLTYLPSSCVEEIVGLKEIKPNKKIAVQFSLNDVKYNGHEMITQNRSSMSPETVVIPLKDDLKLYATLEVNREDKKRTATSNLAAGTKLRIVAYLNGVTWHAQADYTVINTGIASNSKILDGGPLEVIPGNYRFVAYSFNSTDALPAHSETLSDIDPENDLLWGWYPENGGTRFVDASTVEEIPITMTHRFSQITIVATTVNLPGTYTVNSISNVLIPGKLADLNVPNGTLTPKVDIPEIFSHTWSGIGTHTVTSKARVVYTGGAASTIVKIGSLALSGGKNFTNLKATFNKKLLSGVSYTLRISFQKGNIWAGSNIYWVSTGNNTGYLTFDAPDNKERENIQGVFFKWGSLDGISPVGGMNSTARFYRASYNSANPSNTTWTAIPMSNWNNVGPLSGSLAGSIARDNKYLTAMGSSHYGDMYGGKGDICQFITHTGKAPAGNWRMPVSEEFGGASSPWDTNHPNTVAVAGGWTRIGIFSPSIDDFTEITIPVNEKNLAGLFDGFVSGGNYQGSRFPATGVRSPNGAAEYAGVYGEYWSSSLAYHSGIERGYCLTIFATFVAPDNLGNRQTDSNTGMAVRCVMKTPGEE